MTVQDKRDLGLNDEKTALALKDDATGFRAFYAQPSKNTVDTCDSIHHFLGKTKLVTIRSDNSRELTAAAKVFRALHETSTPLTPQSNTRAERDIQEILNGTRANLQQSGLPNSFWTYAAQHFCHYANCTIPFCSGTPLAQIPAETKTPWEQRHNSVWEGPTAPFGCQLDFRVPDSKSFHVSKFEPRTMPGLFLGIHLQPGSHYKGDALVVPLVDLANNVRPRIVRIKSSEVRFPVVQYREDGTAIPLVYQFPVRKAKDSQLAATLASEVHEPIELLEENIEIEADNPTDNTEQHQQNGALEQGGDEAGGHSDANLAGNGTQPDRSEWDIQPSEANQQAEKPEHPPSQQGGRASTDPDPFSRPIKQYGGNRGSKRPPHIWPAEAWTWLSAKQKTKAIAEWENADDDERRTLLKHIPRQGGTCSSSSSAPAAPVEEELSHPAMPLVPQEKVDKFLKHRNKIDFSNVFNAMVARPVTRKEMESNPKGLAAIEKEWSGHRKRYVGRIYSMRVGTHLQHCHAWC